MSSKTFDTTDLRLYGEHINLNSRGDDDGSRSSSLGTCRPRSALYTSNLNVPDSKRRPFSAGNHPNSLPIQPFLKRTQAERRDLIPKPSDFMSRSYSIPGAVDSTILFNKLLKDPITNTKQPNKTKITKNILEFPSRHFLSFDNVSDVSSVDTVTSFGTKIKNKAQINKKLNENNLIEKVEGSPIKLKKPKPQKFYELERMVDENDETKDISNYEPKNTLKLSIYMPNNNNKDDNTSSGVSSSSDVQPFASSSPVPGRSGVQKFTRTKRNISINWFPESTPRSGVTENEDSKTKDHTDLRGIVSFGDGKFESSSLENDECEDDDCPPESGRLYNTELSLVEEESSQDSDMSPKICSSIFERYTSYEKVNNSSVEDKQKHEAPKIENIVQNRQKSETREMVSTNSLKLDLNQCMVNKYNDVSKTIVDRNVNYKSFEDNNESEMERRFREIENKYRANFLQKNEDQIKSLEINYSIGTDGGMKRAWTSLENVVSKENDPVCFAGNKFEGHKYVNDESKDTEINGSYLNYKTSDPVLNNDYRFSKDPYIISPILSDSNQGLIKVPEITSDQRVSRYLKDIPDIIIDYSNDKISTAPFGDSRNSQEHDLINNDEKKDKTVSHHQESNAIVKKETDKADNENVQTTNEEYPDYLQTNEAKQYTSKVIEDYKREIATIDNVHELTLKDIRSSHNERFDIKNYNKLSTPDIEPSCELMEPKMNDTFKLSSTSKVSRLDSQDPLNRDISKFMDEYNTYKLADYKTPILIKVDKADSDYEEINENKYMQSSSLKAKKKIKKKDRSIATKYRNHSGNESGDSGIKRKGKTETKRLAKSAPCKKDVNNRVRFKSQKIVLSKSSTNLNTKKYNDKDNEIMTWMATKISTSDDTNSSNDIIHDTPTPDLIKEKNLEYKIEIHSPSKMTSHETEQQIEPIIKEKQQGISEFISATRDGEEKLKESGVKQSIAKDKIKTKEVSFEVDKYTPSLGEEFSLNDWVGPDTDGNELSDLLDDDNMVTNIYSVLKEIEQTGTSMTSGAGDKLDIKLSNNNTVDETKSAEYRDILSYLEKVENTANDEISSLSHTQPPFSLKVEELMELSKGELAHRAVAGALAAGKAGAAAARLRAALVNAANRAAARIKAERLAARQRANTAAQHSAQTVTRHQKFIEQLINEKKALAERIEKLVAAVEAAEARSARAARASAERLQLELKNQRQRLSQAHQREKQTWLKQHTQKIKDMTIKGLEGEIRELEEKHAAQMLSVQKNWEDKISEEKEKHSREMRVLKESSTRHLEDELDRERLLAAERMEQKRVEWESALAAASERAGAEGRELARGARKEAEQWKRDKEKELEDRRRQLEEQAEEKRNALMLEATQLKDKFTKEFEKYKVDYKKRQADLMRDKEMEIRAVTRRERDREIERAIESMEADAEEGRKEMQESIRRIKLKYESDMKGLEDAEQSALQRCKEARELLRESQELCAQNQITITQLEGKLRQADELRAQTIAEMEISMRTAEMKSREEVEEVRAQLLNLQLQHKDEMHQLYAKVKVAVSKKDDALIAARRDAATLRDRCLRLEARLAV